MSCSWLTASLARNGFARPREYATPLAFAAASRREHGAALGRRGGTPGRTSAAAAVRGCGPSTATPARNVRGGGTSAEQSAIPAIEMHSILVLDRWSLFDKPTAHRTSLRRALDTACRTSCHEAGAPEFDYEWISLADTTRPATNPDNDTVQVARHFLLDDSFPDRVLLIDRKDAGNAVIERPLADTPSCR